MILTFIINSFHELDLRDDIRALCKKKSRILSLNGSAHSSDPGLNLNCTMVVGIERRMSFPPLVVECLFELACCC
jgi:hypothetical protein